MRGCPSFLHRHPTARGVYPGRFFVLGQVRRPPAGQTPDLPFYRQQKNIAGEISPAISAYGLLFKLECVAVPLHKQAEHRFQDGFILHPLEHVLLRILSGRQQL